MASGIVYSNARVKARETGFIDSEKITRMCHAENLKNAVKVLMESNYGGGVMVDNPYEYEKILGAEEKVLNEFMTEIMPKNSGMEVFLYKIDYHNAKAVLKAFMQNVEPDSSELMSGGSLARDRLISGVTENANLLPAEMASAVTALKDGKAGGKAVSPRDIDVALDKAYYDTALTAAKRAKEKYIIKYVTASIDIANFSSFVRSKRVGDRKLFNELFIVGGTLSKDTCDKLFDESADTIYERLKFSRIGALIKIACDEINSGGNLIEFERAADDYLLNIFKDNRYDIFGVSPMAGYYLAKKYEIKALRTILICVKNNVSTEEIKKRLRANYA